MRYSSREPQPNSRRCARSTIGRSARASPGRSPARCSEPSTRPCAGAPSATASGSTSSRYHRGCDGRLEQANYGRGDALDGTRVAAAPDSSAPDPKGVPPMVPQVQLYDTTLRDGMQGEG